ncbi:MAG: hypothetical protein ACR2LK_14020 [Solirubrobacteraceae bacterium]
MIRDPQPATAPVNRPTPDAQEMQALVDAATKLSADTGVGFTEALVLAGQPSVRPYLDLGSITMLDLCDDPERTDDVVLAVMVERRLAYTDALQWLLDRYDRTGQWQSPEDRQALTLSAVLDGSGTSMGRVMTLVGEHAQARTLAATEHAQARTLAAPAQSIAKREINDWGEIEREMGEDLDALLADPLVVRRDFRRARKLALVADDGIAEPDESPEFKIFETAWRAAVNHGSDLLATLELRDGERQAELIRQRQVDQIERKAQQDRLDEARKQRQLGDQLLADAARLEAGR